MARRSDCSTYDQERWQDRLSDRTHDGTVRAAGAALKKRPKLRRLSRGRRGGVPFGVRHKNEADRCGSFIVLDLGKPEAVVLHH